MKIVKEYLNEKFTEDSDPITDMGIGIEAQLYQFLESLPNYYYNKNIDKNNYKKITYLCVNNDKEEFVEFLLQKYASEIFANYYAGAYDLGYTTIARNNLEMFKLLIKYGLDKVRNLGEYLSLACNRNKTDFIKYLVEKGTDVNYKNGEPLISASVSDNVNVIQYLIDNGADVNIADDRALTSACRNGRLKAIRLLLDNGAKINDRLRSNLKYWEAIHKRVRVINIFKKRGLI